MRLPPKTCPECSGELRRVDGDLACTQLTKREVRAGQAERCLRQTGITSLQRLYDVLAPSWGRVQVITALHDLQAQRVVKLAPRGASDVAISLVEQGQAA